MTKTDNGSHLVNMDNARVDDQREVMQQIIDDGVCPFCEENLEKYHPKPILFRTGYWIVTENAWPYKATKKHFLLVYRPSHLEKSEDLPPEALTDLAVVMARLSHEQGLTHGTLLMRFGDMAKTGATVKHLHIQLVQSDPDHPEYDPSVGLLTRIG
jgi:diadenosine tetraphosphate (Ap4A) HIT family hydrolase